MNKPSLVAPHCRARSSKISPCFSGGTKGGSGIAPSAARVITETDRRAILKAAREHVDAPRRVLIYCLLRYCGLRASELCNLTVGQVWDGYRARQELVLLRDQTKGKRTGRRNSLLDKHHHTERAIAEYAKAERKRTGSFETDRYLILSVTDNQLDRTNLWRLWQRMQISAGIPEAACYTVHDARHTWATCAEIESGGDLTLVQQALGHSDQRTTQRYLHRSTEQLHRVNAQMGV